MLVYFLHFIHDYFATLKNVQNFDSYESFTEWGKEQSCNNVKKHTCSYQQEPDCIWYTNIC